MVLIFSPPFTSLQGIYKAAISGIALLIAISATSNNRCEANSDKPTSSENFQPKSPKIHISPPLLNPLKGQRKQTQEQEIRKQTRMAKIDSLLTKNNETSCNRALKLIAAAMRSESNNAKLWWRLGIGKQSLKDYGGALKAYEIANRLEPSNPETIQMCSNLREYLAGRMADAPKIPSVAIEWTPYLADVRRRVKRAWFANPQQMLPCRISFRISRDGRMSALKDITANDGSRPDSAEIRSIDLANPYRPLPYGAPEFISITASFNKRKTAEKILRVCKSG